MKKRVTSKYYWFIALCLAAGLAIYPFPSTGFLYRNAEVLEGRVSRLKGASVVLFLDPSFYYKFKISPLNLRYAVSVLGLAEDSKVSQRNFYVKKMKRGPLFWNSWWWRPRNIPEAGLYRGYRNGNRFYLLYNRASQVAYLYIQNT